MSLFDNWTDPTASSFIGEAEKEELIAARTALQVTGVSKGATKYGITFFVRVQLENEERTLTFKEATEDGGVTSRDALLEHFIVELAAGQPAPLIALERHGRAIFVVDAMAEPGTLPGRE